MVLTKSFPPRLVVGGQRDVGKDAVFAQGRERVGVGALTGARCDAKKPASGFIAHSLPSGPKCIQQMSSPTVVTLNSSPSEGTIIARLVLLHADGNAAAMYVVSPRLSSMPRISMCSASQPSSRPMVLAMRSA